VLQNEPALLAERRETKKIQRWTNIVTANIFKALRLTHRGTANQYAQTARRLQKLADGHRDIVLRSYVHVSNNHKGLLDIQADELREVKQILIEILNEVERSLRKAQLASCESVALKDRALRNLAERLNKKQIDRIQDRSSKTRLTILFYAIVGNMMMISKQSLRLLNAFEDIFGETPNEYEFDLD